MDQSWRSELDLVVRIGNLELTRKKQSTKMEISQWSVDEESRWVVAFLYAGEYSIDVHTVGTRPYEPDVDQEEFRKLILIADMIVMNEMEGYHEREKK